MAFSPPYPNVKLYLDKTDYSEYLLPDSLRIRYESQRHARTLAEFQLKGLTTAHQLEGGQRVDVYLPSASSPVFSGQVVRVVPRKHSPSAWTAVVQAQGWEYHLESRQSFLQFRNLTYHQAAQAVLQDSAHVFPSVLNDVLDPYSLLTGEMPFYSINGMTCAEVLDRIAVLSSTAWRIVQTSEDVFDVQYYDPFTYLAERDLEFTNTSNNFKWGSFQPVLLLDGLINTQTVRGAVAPADSEEIAYFRGDGLSSKFPLPLVPYNNINRVELIDEFDGAGISTATWLETDSVSDHVYQDGDGFLQFDISGSPQWVGLESRANIERGNSPIGTWDITWINSGEAMFGFSKSDFVSSTPYEWLDAGIYIDSTNTIQIIANGAIDSAYTGLTLDPSSTQYRFRIWAKEDGGAIFYYQSGSDIYTRNWTEMAEVSAGTASDLSYIVFSKDADMNMDSAKCTNPYLGIKVEVDRGLGYVEETIGIAQIDEDTDAVLEGSQTISFFGSDPGPSTIPPAPDTKTFEVTDTGTDTMTIVGGHGLATGSAIKVSSDTTLPAGLVPATTYYFRSVSFTAFQLFTSKASAEDNVTADRVDITDSGTGIHTLSVNVWEGVDVDYPNIKITYKVGQRLQATYRDSGSITQIAGLFGLSDNGVRAGRLIVDETLTSYEACLTRAQLEVINNNKILRSIKAETNWNVFQDTSTDLPLPGDVCRFNVSVDMTDTELEGDIPISTFEVVGMPHGNNFRIRMDCSYVDRGFAELIQDLQKGLFISISDRDVLFRNNYQTETLSLGEANAEYIHSDLAWGDSRFDVTFTVNDTTDVLTATAHELVTGQQVGLSTAGTLPAGSDATTTYYFHNLTANTGYLYDTLANALAGTGTGRVDFTDTGSGVHTLAKKGWRWGYHNWGSFYIDQARVMLSGSDVLPANITVS